MNDQVVLVDEQDIQVGLMPKLEAHQKGVLHRAFSVFVFNSKGELLLQRRAFGKYHSEGLWSNTCCSHPYPGESVHHAAERRLMEEMGIEAELHYLYTFQYHAKLDNNLTENEVDHVFWATTDMLPEINIEEVSEFRYERPENVSVDLKANPEAYTEWLKICFDDVMQKIKI